MQVFVSHCTEDADFAQQIAHQLRSNGIDVWIAPDSIATGETFIEAIQRGLAETTHFVVLLSPDALESKWVNLEINTAIRLDMEGALTIAPIMYRPATPPLILGNYQWLDYRGDVTDIVNQLLDWVGTTRPEAWDIRRPANENEIALAGQALDQIAQEVVGCSQCPLHEERNHAVPGAGAANARLMFVGEAPGPADDETGEPFVSAAGEFLTELLDMIEIDRQDVFLTNVVKCRPHENRDPKTSEMKACSGLS